MMGTLKPFFLQL